MPSVVVECFLLGIVDGHVVLDEGEDVPFAPTWTASAGDRAPQQVVTASATVPLHAPPHSTSWRGTDGRITLTFAAFPAAGVELRRPRRVPVYAPGTSTVTRASVVGHAVRHVAFLVRTDPSFRTPDADAWAEATSHHVPDVFRDWS